MIYTCPYCSYEMPEDEADSTCDCGCPLCRHIIHWEDWDEPYRSVNEISFELRKAHSKVSDKTHRLKLENSNLLYHENEN